MQYRTIPDHDSFDGLNVAVTDDGTGSTDALTVWLREGAVLDGPLIAAMNDAAETYRARGRWVRAVA